MSGQYNVSSAAHHLSWDKFLCEWATVSASTLINTSRIARGPCLPWLEPIPRRIVFGRIVIVAANCSARLQE